MPLEILPSIDLRDGKVVRLKQGDYAQQLNYDVDPIATARSFQQAGSNWLHIVDLDGAKEGRPAQTDLIARIISASGLAVEVGGGIRSADDVQRLLDAGAARVVVGTKAIEDWAWFETLARKPLFYNKLVLALDAKDGMVATRGWTETSTRRAVDLAREISDWPVAAILYTDVAKDGMLQGPNIAHTRLLAEAGNVPVIASGGVGSLEHVRQVRENSPPIWGCIIGRSLYEGTVDLREAIRIARGYDAPMPLTTIYQARDETQAQLLIAILQSHGIEASMEQGASATNAMFAPGMFRGGIGVLVDEAHADQARAIAHDFDQSGREPSDDSPQPAPLTWTCPNCGETVEAQFSDCWNCQTPRPADAPSSNP